MWDVGCGQLEGTGCAAFMLPRMPGARPCRCNSRSDTCLTRAARWKALAALTSCSRVRWAARTSRRARWCHTRPTQPPAAAGTDPAARPTHPPMPVSTDPAARPTQPPAAAGTDPAARPTHRLAPVSTDPAALCCTPSPHSRPLQPTSTSSNRAHPSLVGVSNTLE